MKFGRATEIALGTLFIASAALKALDVYSFAVQVSYYGIVKEPESLVRAVAFAMIGVESVLGVALLAGVRRGGKVLFATAALLIGFTALIAYGWLFKGLKDCGCFGAYMQMGPVPSMIKNVVLLAMTAVAWYGTRAQTQPHPETAEGGDAPAEPTPARRQLVLPILGIAVILLAFAFGKSAPAPTNAVPTNGNNADAPFAKFQPDLGGAPVPLDKGEFFVAMLSATCEHCQAATAVLNDLAATPGIPQIAGIVGGTEDEFKAFMATTAPDFPVQRIDMIPFMSLIGNAPPRFYMIKNGAEVRHFDIEDPTFDDLLDFATQTDKP